MESPHSRRGLKLLKSFDVVDVANVLRSFGHPTLREPLSNDINYVAELDRVFWLADEEFLRTDKILMHFGMEGRFPLLKKDLVTYANSLSVEEKLRGGLKSHLKNAYNDRLPSYILNKCKSGWNAPIVGWMHSEFGEMVKQVLSRDYYAPTNDLFEFEDIKEAYINNKTTFTLRDLKHFLPLFSFQMWARSFGITV